MKLVLFSSVKLAASLHKARADILTISVVSLSAKKLPSEYEAMSGSESLPNFWNTYLIILGDLNIRGAMSVHLVKRALISRMTITI